MNYVTHILLAASGEQTERLKALQQAFAEVCNALAPVVQKNRCWNRVGLHHLAYRDMRMRFPQMGSQMVCNAIYSVSRTCRRVFQHAKSPWNVVKFPGKPLPLLRFLPTAPVYFDRHTLSIKDGQLSMYTLDGRIRFRFDLGPEDVRRFRELKLREVILANAGPGYRLSFVFTDGDSSGSAETDKSDSQIAEVPEYVVVITGDGMEANIPAMVMRPELASDQGVHRQ